MSRRRREVYPPGYVPKRRRKYEKRNMWRRTVNVNGIVIRNIYYSLRVTAYAWRKDRLPSFDELREIAMKEIERFTGYSREKWWFGYEIGEEEARIPYDPLKDGEIEVQWEEEE